MSPVDGFTLPPDTGNGAVLIRRSLYEVLSWFHWGLSQFKEFGTALSSTHRRSATMELTAYATLWPAR